ncbi:FecR family protein [Pseudozobellia sp. WGM2]|uniref:FecR family protein n=1 Tax=Pseudozobellia sp. WGM2 TaxID=2787625 RepID=UPI001AE046A3|nr:FecR family protein [Pseudozobellia sp. WGM2]
MKIEKIIIKYLNHEADIHELEMLDKWLKYDENEHLFTSYVKIDLLSQVTMDQYDLNAAKKTIKSNIKQQKRSKRITVYKNALIAASITAILFTGFNWKLDENSTSNTTEVESEGKIQAGESKAVLTLGNGNEVILGKGKEYKDKQLISNGEEIRYNKKAGQEQNQLNQLSVPKGGQFYIELADGTEVWLNSGSKLKYPTSFKKAKKREVELLFGEAFFKVSSSNLHRGAPFYVKTQFQGVKVMGTEFNIKAYADDDEIKTTLIEGKVEVSKNNTVKEIKPNQQSIVSNKSENIIINKVNAKHEIAWIDGLFSFNDESLRDIMATLSRWYDIQIVFENAEQKDYTFTGVVERSESIHDLLNLIERTSDNQIKFETNEKTIVIK